MRLLSRLTFGRSFSWAVLSTESAESSSASSSCWLQEHCQAWKWPQRICKSSYSSSTYSGVMKRFYKFADISESTQNKGQWHVLVDGKRVKTPSGVPLAVPSQMLALAIAAEFQTQPEDIVRTITQPLFRLAWQTQDHTTKASELIDKMLQYVDSDPVCSRHALDGWSSQAAQQQQIVYDPIVAWANRRFAVDLKVSDSILGAEQDVNTHLAYAEFLSQLPYHELLPLSELCGAGKSLLIGFALAEHQMSIEEAVEASRIEEDMQMREFGMVEGGHDLDIVDLRTRMAGAALMLQMLRLDGPGAAM